MPRFAREFSSQTISQRLEPGGKHRFDIRRRELPDGFSDRVPIHAGAQRARWNETICRVAGSERNSDCGVLRILSWLLSQSRVGLKQGNGADYEMTRFL